MFVFHDPETLLHESVELLGAKLIPALECPARLEAILNALKDSDHLLRLPDRSPSQDDQDKLLSHVSSTHDVDYLQHLVNVHHDWTTAGLVDEKGVVLPECFRVPSAANTNPQPPKDIYARPGYYAFDMSSGMSADSWTSIHASAGLACDGATILSQEHEQPTPPEILALCRPPGHHCDGRKAGGYCYLNNAAVAVTAYRFRAPSSKIGILDLDFHHGNGTQEIFYDDPTVFYVSIHGEDEFPYYTGSAKEIGIGAGKGTNLNLPLATGSSADDYLKKLEIGVGRLVMFSPEFLIISLGFDTFHLDPLGSFKIETDDYAEIAGVVRAALRQIPALILLEGGYVIEHLGANLLSFLKGWEMASRGT